MMVTNMLLNQNTVVPQRLRLHLFYQHMTQRDIQRGCPFCFGCRRQNGVFLWLQPDFLWEEVFARFCPSQSSLAKVTSHLVGNRSVEVGGGLRYPD